MSRLSIAAEGLRARLQGLRVVVDETPTSDFRAAIEHLVDAEDDTVRFAHRTLAEPTRVRKRNVVVYQRDEPVLATTLRERQDRWELATTTVFPTAPIPHRPGYLESALSAIGMRILIVDHLGDAREDFRRQEISPFDSYVAPLSGFDLEAYWRSTRLWQDLQRAERKTAHLDVVHDDPATLSWSIDTWEGRWTDHPSDEAGAADDLRAIWPRLLEVGQLKTTALVDGDGTPLASNVNLVAGETLVGLITARDTAAPASVGSIGTRVAVECFRNARAAGLSAVDLGGYHDYKRRLAPPGRVAFEVAIEPRIIAADATARSRRIAGTAKRRLCAFVASRGRS